jgi:ATP-binding cassette subfamily B protein
MLKIAWSIRPGVFIGYMAGGLIETGASILTIYASAKLAALLAGFIATGATEGIWFWLYVDIFAASLTGLGFWIMKYCERLNYFSVSQWAVNRFLGAMSIIDIPDFYDDTTRNQINKVQSGVSYMIPNLSYMLFELIYGLMRFVAIAIVVSQINLWLVVIIVLFLIPSLISDSWIAKISWLIWEEKGDNRYIFSSLQHILPLPKEQMEIRSMQTRKYLLNKVHHINALFYRSQETKYRRASRFGIAAKFFEVGGVAIGSVVLLRQFLTHQLSLERYFFLSGALLRIGGALNAIFGTLSRLQEPLQFADSYFAVIDSQPTIVDPPNAIKLTNTTVPIIEFKDISFTYPGQDKPVFSDLNLTIKAGEHIAIVGENGAGKSTLIKLLMRFYVPDSGVILINGHDLQTVAIDTWYSQLATLFQNFNQYPFPIDENIYVTDPSSRHDKNRIEEAARLGGVDQLVKEYEYGWETVLDASFEKGIEPSGGQWQRVALARAFFRNANLLILDEPTAAIDARAEYDIFNNIFEKYKTKSAIIVSHRFSTVRRADTILVIEHGQIIERGSHKELMKNKGLYHELFTKQAEGYKE